TKITIYKFTPQLFTLTLINGIRFRTRKTYKKMFSERKRKGTSGQRKAYLLIQNKHIPLHSPYFYR
ncbi:hypothetical protein DWZ06_03375, partial [Phocaeicola vulgatus]